MNAATGAVSGHVALATVDDCNAAGGSTPAMPEWTSVSPRTNSDDPHRVAARTG